MWYDLLYCFELLIDFRSIFQLFTTYFVQITRNIDRYRYRIILYSSTGLGDGIRWVGSACIVVKKNEYVHCICGCIYTLFVVLCCTITSYSNYCTVQKQIGDERMKPNCLHDSDRVSGRNRQVACSNGTFKQSFIAKQPPLIGDRPVFLTTWVGFLW